MMTAKAVVDVNRRLGLARDKQGRPRGPTSLIYMLISTKYFYTAELVQLPVLTAHYGDLPYKTFLDGCF
jgi:hypothetical protein